MQAYTGFAYVYDEYMDNIPYEEWCEYLVERLKEQGVTPDMEIADLGCGTGTVTQLLDKAGYSCVGIDNAPDMLTIAAEKLYESGQEIVYSLQDMRDFELPYEVDAMVSIADSMNYITSKEDIPSVRCRERLGCPNIRCATMTAKVFCPVSLELVSDGDASMTAILNCLISLNV